MKIHGYPLWHYFIAGSHSLTGYLTPLVGVFIGPWLAVLLWVSFWGYEVLEWLYFWWIDKKPDKVYSDVLEYSIPLFTTSIVLLALRVVGVL